MAKTVKLVLNEYLSQCGICAAALEAVLVKVPGVRGRVLRLDRRQRLIITPDYNAAGILTHFHVEVFNQGESL